MTPERYRSIVRKAEQLAATQPAAYRRRVAMLAALGTGYIALVLFGALFTSVAILVGILVTQSAALIKLAFLPFCLVWVLAKSFRVRFDLPEGRILSRAQAPALFDEIEAIRKALHAAPVHTVLCTQTFNAAVTQIPRFGLLGGQHNYLILGLPLMASLSPDQFRAVLAHEIGHMSAGHTAFGSLIYRTRRTWTQLLVALNAQRSVATVIFTEFFRRFAPYFNAYSFALARADEFEADRRSAAVTSPDILASALTATSVRAAYFQDRFRDELFNGAKDDKEPPPHGYSRFIHALRTIDPGYEKIRLHQVLQYPSDLNDTHPAFVDRLRALGRVPVLEAATQPTAADHYLSAVFEDLCASGDKEWQSAMLPSWQEQYQRFRESRGRLKALKSKTVDQLSTESLFQRAKFTAEIVGEEHALIDLDALLQREPDHVRARVLRGIMLLRRGEGSGVGELERMMRTDPNCRSECAWELYKYFIARDDRASGERYWAMLGPGHA